MQIHKIRFVLLMTLLTLVQLIINKGGIIYLDCIGVVLITLLVNGQYSLRMLIFSALFADLIGYWYLGTHLFTTIIVSFITAPLVNFYRISNPIQKVILASIFYAFSLSIIALIGVLTHNLIFSWGGFFLNIFIVCPIILWMIANFMLKPCSDIIY